MAGSIAPIVLKQLCKAVWLHMLRPPFNRVVVKRITKGGEIVKQYDHKVYEVNRTRLAVGLVLTGLLVMVVVPIVWMYFGLLASCIASAAGLMLVWLVLPKDWNFGFAFTRGVYRRWFNACSVVGMVEQYWDGKEQATRYPKLTDISGNEYQWRAVVEPRESIGWNIAKFRAVAPDMQAAMGAGMVRFTIEQGGLIVVSFSSVSMPVRNVVIVEPAPPEETPLQRIKAVPIARDMETNEVYKLSLLDGHILLAGISRAGKSGYIWSLVVGLYKPIALGYVRLWGLDPKGIELGVAPGWWDFYADTPDEMVQLLENAVADMWERKKPLKGKARKFTPSPDMPLNLIVIDELAYVTSLLPTEKPKGGLSLQQRADRAIKELLTQGAGFGYILMGAVQDPTKETVPSRDLWSTSIALKLRAGMINLVLGVEARQDGARCDLIPSMSKGGAGQAYVDVRGEWRRVYARWWEDDELTQVADTMRKFMHARAARAVKEVNTDKLVAAGQLSVVEETT